MNFEQINKRVDLFKEYLRYRIDTRWNMQWDNFQFIPTRRYGVTEMMRRFHETGIMIYNSREIQPEPKSVITFDEWLFDHQHYELVDLQEYERQTAGLINYVQKEGKEISWPYDGSRLNRFFIPSNQDVDEWGGWKPKSDMAVAMGWAMQASKYSAAIDPFEIGGVNSAFSVFKTKDGVTEYLGRSKSK